MGGKIDSGLVGTIKCLRSIELCAGAGGLALGLEQAGFDPVVLVDYRKEACATLSTNRPKWAVLHRSIHAVDPLRDLYSGYEIDLISAGLPRVKSSATASRARGDSEELELLEATGRLVSELRPRALLVENVPDLVRRAEYAASRSYVEKYLDAVGYEYAWMMVDASEFAVPQHRLLGILVAFRDGGVDLFMAGLARRAPSRHFTVGSVLRDSMASRGWEQAAEWAAYADDLAPTVVGGSWDRGGADLGPRGSQQAWAKLGVNGASLIDAPPEAGFHWNPVGERDQLVKLTVDQVALLQGFPSYWQVCGRKTARYRQIGNATPPPAAHAIGLALRAALSG
ncbi:DNA cytosine methyltransferase [Nocardia sp. bgisy118]|uniref:DNA cytosine methyltransferase n=1 Tax=Nocardia sp. bgisy118 TaxID=3413786 RepID=UPI003F49CA59